MADRGVRMRRVNEALKEVLSGAIGRKVKDPRLGFVTVTAVDATPDLRQAKVYVSVLGKGSEKEATLSALRSAHGYLQCIINQELQLKRTPALEFVYDESIDRGMRIDSLLRNQEETLGIDLDEDTPEPESDDDGS